MAGWVRVAVTVLLLAGCGRERTVVANDAAVPGDASTADAGADAAVPDAGALDAAVSMCAEDLRSPYTGPIPCNTTTRDCAMGCDDARCAEACFAADPSPSCIQCWDVNQLSCWNRNGCQEQWNCVSECITEHCPTFDVACIGEQCGTEDQAYADCFEPLRMMCLERTIECLPD
jgi:hypothetical protein